VVAPTFASLDTFHDQRPGSSSQYLSFGGAVHMRVVPTQPWWLVARNSETIFIRRASGFNQRVQDIVLVTSRGHRESMEMKIGGGGLHRSACTCGDVLQGPEACIAGGWSSGMFVFFGRSYWQGNQVDAGRRGHG
jgi:hypothetical protein